MSCLMRVVYLSYCLRDETASGVHIDLFRQAEQALETCIERSVHSKVWSLTPDEQTIVGPILSLHDEQLAVVPTHRYFHASERMQASLKADPHASLIR